MRYFVRVGGEQYEVTVDGESIAVDGRAVKAHIEDVPATPLQLLSLGTEVHRVLARRGPEKAHYDLSIAGYRFTVEALDERTRAIRDLSAVSKRPVGPAHLVAPMPGLIVRLHVKEGEQVRAGQGLVVMEAMKMENELRATANGIVRRVAVFPGSAVEKGALLLEMEPSDG